MSVLAPDQNGAVGRGKTAPEEKWEPEFAWALELGRAWVSVRVADIAKQRKKSGGASGSEPAPVLALVETPQCFGLTPQMRYVRGTSTPKSVWAAVVAREQEEVNKPRSFPRIDSKVLERALVLALNKHHLSREICYLT